MKNNNGRDPENAYWLRGTQLPQIRGRIILGLLDLMDKYYQERKWIYDEVEGKKLEKPISFHHEVTFPFEMLEDVGLYNALEEEKPPYDDIGWIYKNKKEVEHVYEVAKILRPYWRNNYTNQEYLESPQLTPLRKASLEAFKVFMENEKNNNEFCNFILNIIKEERNFFDIKFDNNKPPYQSILDYVKKCEEALGL